MISGTVQVGRDLEGLWPNLLLREGQLGDGTGLLRALPRGLKTSEGDSTVSLGNLHCPLPEKAFHYTQSVPLMV